MIETRSSFFFFFELLSSLLLCKTLWCVPCGVYL